MTGDDVAAAVTRTYPGRPVADRTPVETGNRKRTVVVRFGDDATPSTVVVQTGADDAAIRAEAALARAVAGRTDLPVPAVLAGGRLPEHERSYLIAERAVGADLHSRFVSLPAERRRGVARAFGSYLGQLHAAFAFEGYGAVGVDTDEDADAAAAWAAVLDSSDPGRLLRAGVDGDAPRRGTARTGAGESTAPWPRWVRRYAAEGVDALPPAFDDLRPRIRDAVAAAVGRLPASPLATLYPWDLRPGNALVADGAVSAVLDWGEPLAAAPGLAVAKAEHLVCDWYVADSAPLREAFREGYETVRPLPSVPDAYRLVAVVRSAVDGAGVVTRPRYPEVDGEDAVAFHRERIAAVLAE